MYNDNDFLFEGQLEKLGSCSIFSKKPLILWEKHAIDRCFIDRCFIDDAEIQGFDAEAMKNHLLKVCLPKHFSNIKEAWESLNASNLNNPPSLPRFSELKFVIRQPVPFKYYDKKLDDFVDILVECTVQGSYNTIYSPKHEDELTQIYAKTRSFAEVNAYLKDNAPKHATLFPENTTLTSSASFANRIGFNIPYLFIETFVFALIKPSKFPKTFCVGNYNGWKIYNETPFPVKPITFMQYLNMYKKARSLKEVTKYRLLDLLESKQFKSLLDINRRYESNDRLQ